MRGTIFGIAVICYLAALIITLSAVGLPVPKPATSNTPLASTAAGVPLRSLSAKPADVDVAEPTPPQPTPAPLTLDIPKEDSLLELAQAYQRGGDLKKAETTYLLLLKKDNYQDIAALRLGELYFKAGDYRRAEEMYRESARVLRERNASSTDPLQY